MTRFTAIDLSGLVPPGIIQTLDYEAIVTAMRDDLVERFPLTRSTRVTASAGGGYRYPWGTSHSTERIVHEIVQRVDVPL